MDKLSHDFSLGPVDAISASFHSLSVCASLAALKSFVTGAHDMQWSRFGDFLLISGWAPPYHYQAILRGRETLHNVAEVLGLDIPQPLFKVVPVSLVDHVAFNVDWRVSPERSRNRVAGPRIDHHLPVAIEQVKV